MALSTDIEAKSPEAGASPEIELPSMKPVPPDSGTPGLFGSLSQPALALKLCLAALLLGGIAFYYAPLAFPPRTWRQPPPLPPRAPARRPRPVVASPRPEWMRQILASPSPPSAHAWGSVTAAGASQPARRAGGARPQTARLPGSRSQNQPAVPLSARHALSAGLAASPLSLKSGPIRIWEPGGAACLVTPQSVTLNGRRVPAEWAHEARRLLAPLSPEDAAAAPERPPLRLIQPDPADRALVEPPQRLRWSHLPNVSRYQLTLEVLTDPADQVWHPVDELFMVDVTGTEFRVPRGVRWAPGAIYRWRVQTRDGQTEAAAEFRILSPAQRARLIAARRAVGNSYLLRAAVDRAFSRYGTALAELRALQSAHPAAPAPRQAVLNIEADIHRLQSADTG